MRNHELSQREREVLQLAARGLLRREIGHRMGVGERTVNTYLHKIYGKLCVHNRTEAVNRGLELGVINYVEGIAPATARTLLADLAYLRKSLERIERVLEGAAHGHTVHEHG